MSVGVHRFLKLGRQICLTAGFASRCLCCNQRAATPLARLCAPCAQACFDTASAPRSRCVQCATQLFGDALLCGQCLRAPRHFDCCVCLGDYNLISRELVLKAKFGQQPMVARWLGRSLGKKLEDLAAAASPLVPQVLIPPLLVPLPLAPAREAARGYNQALLMARGIKARQRRLSLSTNLLLRVKETQAMSGLDEAERVRMIAGAFVCTRRIDGQQVLLVDDVLTTGASLNEAARVLKAAGATQVTALVALRA